MVNIRIGSSSNTCFYEYFRLSTVSASCRQLTIITCRFVITAVHDSSGFLLSFPTKEYLSVCLTESICLCVNVRPFPTSLSLFPFPFLSLGIDNSLCTLSLLYGEGVFSRQVVSYRGGYKSRSVWCFFILIQT